MAAKVFKMAAKEIIIFALLSVTSSKASDDFKVLFPDTKQYVYSISSNVSTGTLLPSESSSHWTLSGKLYVETFSDTRIRCKMADIKTTVFSAPEHSRASNHAHLLPDEAAVLLAPWEAECAEVFISEDEPQWSANIKRAITTSLRLSIYGSDINYGEGEICLHGTCLAEYNTKDGRVIRKTHSIVDYGQIPYGRRSLFDYYTSPPHRKQGSERHQWYSVMPDFCAEEKMKKPFVGEAVRVYRLDDRGLQTLDLKSVIQYHSHNHILAVNTMMTLTREGIEPLGKELVKLDLKGRRYTYETHTYRNPTNGRRSISQETLRIAAKELLAKISANIDFETPEKDADKIHSTDLIELHEVMSQLHFESLKTVYNDLKGTSYDLETSRGLFLEILPHAKSGDSALFVKYLVVEDELEDKMQLTSMVRKLPFNVANYSKELLLEMESLLRLSPTFAPELRHAAILSFSTLAYRTYYNGGCDSHTFDEYIKRYFLMYQECPQYVDRMVWLQGLANLQLDKVGEYLLPLIQNAATPRHERYLAMWASKDLGHYWSPTYWTILTDDSEHIQLRISALALLLSSEQIPSRILAIHQYVESSGNEQIKKFWYTSVKSFEKSTFGCHQTLAKLTSYVSNLVRPVSERHWATGNYILDTSDQDRDSGAMAQFWSIGEPQTGLPAAMFLSFSTNQGGLLTTQITVMMKAEGVAASFLNKLSFLNSESIQIEKLAEILKNMKVQTVAPERVHIELIVKVQGKTVYATYLNQTTFDSWTGVDMLNTVKDFLSTDSHVNQQLIHFPLQMDYTLATELGTPVTLKSTVVSFPSIRGNLNMRKDDAGDIKRANDFHIRYIGTAVTTLSSFGPLLGSEHTVRIQQSTLAHLPLKFDIIMWLTKQAFEINWLNDDPTGGVAFHSRAQVSLSMGLGRSLKSVCPTCVETYTVRSKMAKRKLVENYGIYFDCDRPMTGFELIEQLLDSNKANYNFFTALRPSLILVHSLFLLSVPPSSACGLMLGSRFPVHLTNDTQLDFRAQLLQFVNEDSGFGFKVKHDVVLREREPNEAVQYSLSGSSFFENKDEKIRFALKLVGYQPSAQEPFKKNWKLCLEEKGLYLGTPEQDISPYPGDYEGTMTLAFGNDDSPVPCPVTNSALKIQYKGRPQINENRDLERELDIVVLGQKLPKLYAVPEDSWPQPISKLGDLLKKISAERFNMTASIQEKSGLADVSIDSGPAWQFNVDKMSWLLDSWSRTQLLRKFGLYRECHLQESTVQTLAGATEKLEPLDCPENLVLADCTQTPRFAILRQKGGGYKFYTGGNSVLVQPQQPSPRALVNGEPVDYSGAEGYKYPPGEKFYDFKIQKAGDSVRVTSLSGVQLFYKPGETLILMPNTYMNVACGSCASQHYYKLC